MNESSHRVRPPRRKRFGQHFLHDPAVLDRIVTAVAPRDGDRLIEIGPGRGALTARLLESGVGRLDAVEIDRDLGELLLAEPAFTAKLVLHQADALRFNFTGLAQERGGKLRVIGNLPYNISTPLLFHLLDHAAAIEDMHVMLQREVAARIAASAGDPDYGRLAIMMAPWVDVELLFDVGPGAFQPPPRVWSSVARLSVRSQPRFPVSAHFARVVATAFCHRRKTVRNGLRGLIEPQRIVACGVDPAARPETISPQAFNALAGTIDA